MSLAGHLYRSVFQTAPLLTPARPIRAFLRLPVVFDLTVLALQARDLGRVSRLKDSYIVTSDHHRRTHDYNADVTQARRITSSRHPEEFYQIATMPPRDVRDERLLIVGPRNVLELYVAWLQGFRWRNIEAIDLYSTNPKIRTMNMEDMEWPDESFDVVTMSAVLAYAEDPKKAIMEAARILKPGGRFVFGHPYDPSTPEWPGNLIRGSALKSMLKDAGLALYFHRSTDKINSTGNLQTTHRFGARKIDLAKEEFDPVEL